MIETKFKWVADIDPKYFEKDYDEDSNWFETREQALIWLQQQKEKYEDFAEGCCFHLVEMFFI